MCGLAGFYYERPIPASIILDALHEIENRGRDGTGLAHLSADGKWDITKSQKKASKFVQTDMYKDFVSSYRKIPGVMMLHTRGASSGWITARNSHPFRHGNLIGAHNGVMYYKAWYGSSYGDEEVDSSLAIKIMSIEGIEESVRRLPIWGALSILDIKEREIILITLDKVLSIGFSKDRKIVAWSSFPEHEWLTKWSHTNGEIDEGNIFRISLKTGKKTLRKIARLRGLSEDSGLGFYRSGV